MFFHKRNCLYRQFLIILCSCIFKPDIINNLIKEICDHGTHLCPYPKYLMSVLAHRFIYQFSHLFIKMCESFFRLFLVCTIKIKPYLFIVLLIKRQKLTAHLHEHTQIFFIFYSFYRMDHIRIHQIDIPLF